MEEQYRFVDSLPLDVKNIVYNYTDDSYKQLNEKLRSNILLSKQERILVDTLDDLFDDISLLTETLIVYRGISKYYPFENINTFISTSLDKNVSISFSGKYCCILQIILPPGSKVIPLRSMSKLPGEEEILLPRNGNFQITFRNETIFPYIYHLVYLPKNSISIKNKSKKEIDKELDQQEIDYWVKRILNLITDLDLEIFGPEEAVYSVINTTLKEEKISEKAIKLVIKELS